MCFQWCALPVAVAIASTGAGQRLRPPDSTERTCRQPLHYLSKATGGSQSAEPIYQGSAGGVAAQAIAAPAVLQRGCLRQEGTVDQGLEGVSGPLLRAKSQLIHEVVDVALRVRVIVKILEDVVSCKVVDVVFQQLFQVGVQLETAHGAEHLLDRCRPKLVGCRRSWTEMAVEDGGAESEGTTTATGNPSRGCPIAARLLTRPLSGACGVS